MGRLLPTLLPQARPSHGAGFTFRRVGAGMAPLMVCSPEAPAPAPAPAPGLPVCRSYPARSRAGRYGVRSWLGGAVVVGLVVLVVAERSVLASAWHALAGVQWRWLGAVLGAEVASKAAVARVHRRLLAAGGTTVPFRSVLAVTYAGNAVSMTVPVVGAELAVAFSYRQFSRRGASVAAAGWTFLVSGALATTAYALLSAVGAAVTGTRWGLLLGVGGALAAAVPGWVLVAVLRRPAARQRLFALVSRLLGHLPGRARRSGPAAEALAASVGEQLGALRLSPRDWAGVFLLAVANWAVDALCLAAAIAAVGAPVPWSGLLLAYLAAAGLSSLAVTPGGLGTVELALTSALVAAGLDVSHALAAALVYRLVTLWLATSVGWLLYAGLSTRVIQKVHTSGSAG